jgi:hypothetical protein
MVIQTANVIGGILLAEPLLGRVSWLEKPVRTFNEALNPYRMWVGVAELGLAGGAILCSTGLLNISLLYGADVLDIGLAVLMGGLLAAPLWDRFLPRWPLCGPLHENEAYIGTAGIVVGVSRILF